MPDTQYFTNIDGKYVKDAEARQQLNDLEDYVEDIAPVPLSVDSNGTYTAPTGVFGYSPVTVNVSPVDYSTTEQDTGRKWIDGKPIYQKTFVPTAPATYWTGRTTSGKGDLIDISDLHVDTFIKVEGLGSDSTDCTTNIWNIEAMSMAGVRTFYYPDKDTLGIYMQTGYVFWVTLYYTKTTDTPAE